MIMKGNEKIIIVPHTHWDREWYLPFQEFRFKLVHLIDELLDIEADGYRFMLDGQTIVLEDYLEIKPGNQDRLVRKIKNGSIRVGPWYLLPDEWLVGQESLIRNLECSHRLATDLGIPLMKIGYLPDQFGHTSAIPQVLGDLTKFKAAAIWRGVGREITTVPFTWKSRESATSSILGIYLAGGYGNAARLPDKFGDFKEQIDEFVEELEILSPVPVYLLMNGSDHLFPQEIVHDHVESLAGEGIDIQLGILDDFVNELSDTLDKENVILPIHGGEFRSPERAPLLQDTYSSRMWIKQENQECEDILVHGAEPLSSLAWY
ncbi:alpha-mannosidase, partial [Candidatus Bathyarchaeota archaeon]|nr:alpha-mannosidase [Candidatus Bathyarchaeota archaeon]